MAQSLDQALAECPGEPALLGSVLIYHKLPLPAETSIFQALNVAVNLACQNSSNVLMFVKRSTVAVLWPL